MTLSPPKIELLPEHLIDQIKAGEVIERPGNLLKEILENAVDSGASKLELTIKNNGLDLISLKDNGHGMRFSDLPLAFSRHATSKIGRFEDLYKLRTFGFRGEALASIASISKVQCISFTKDQPEGSELRIEGGEQTFHGKRQAQPGSQGTELVIQDIFYNTPARLKFIQSQSAEKQFIRKVIFSFILSNPHVEFHVKIDDGEKEIHPARETLKERLADLMPKAKESILYSERFYENNELELYLIPGQLRAPLKLQYVFINNRMILDKQFHRVLSNSLQQSFGQDDFHYIIFLHLPPDAIDVNVHPNKTIIKCLESSKIIGLLTGTVKELSQGKKMAPVPQVPVESHPSLLPGLSSAPSLLQERHEYNMEGIFSPHLLNLTSSRDHRHTWIGGSFLLWEANGSHTAISLRKLLELYVRTRIQERGISIPLLVSEPYSARGIKEARIVELQEAGLELELMGQETYVLRGIPEWMNGFPLKEIISALLQEKGFQDLVINQADWGQSTWEEILGFFSHEELLRQKIAVDLHELLKEKLR